MVLIVLPSAALQVNEMDASSSEANPLLKIVGMMEDMRTELEKEAKDIFDEAMCICKKGEKELGGVVTFSTSEIERLESAVESGTANKAKLASEIKDHEQDKVDTTKSLQ